MKTICAENNIPTAGFKICTKINQVKSFMHKFKLPMVVKADGLAAGKGVTICKTKKQVLKLPAKYLKENLSHLKKLY